MKTDILSDEAIILQIRSGQHQQFAVLIRRYQAKLDRYTVYLLSDPAAADDALQETFISAYVNLQSFNVKRKFSSWIYRIAHNHCMTYLRRQKNQVSFDEDFDMAGSEDIEDNFINQETKNRVLACLDEIPIIYREPLTLYYFQDQKYDDIADILHISTSVVGVRINRAKKIMKKICQKK